jgi:outer membrane receptor for ferrienterochelin and colicin
MDISLNTSIHSKTMKSRLLLILAIVVAIPLMATFSCKSSGPVANNQDASLKNAPAPNMEELMRRQAFVTVMGSGANVQLQIRGQRTMQGGVTEPMLIVDGVRVGNTFDRIANLNPNDVQRIRVIRDPGELAGYGLGAAGGVIEIYLKK